MTDSIIRSMKRHKTTDKFEQATSQSVNENRTHIQYGCERI